MNRRCAVVSGTYILADRRWPPFSVHLCGPYRLHSYGPARGPPSATWRSRRNGPPPFRIPRPLAWRLLTPVARDPAPQRPLGYGAPLLTRGTPPACVAPCPPVRRSGGILPCAPDRSNTETPRNNHVRSWSALSGTESRLCPARS